MSVPPCPRTPEARMDVISHFAARYERTREEEISLEDYLAECKRNPLAYATAAERMLRAIGEPTTVDTRNDPRLSRLFANKVIKVYPAFAEYTLITLLENRRLRRGSLRVSTVVGSPIARNMRSAAVA